MSLLCLSPQLLPAPCLAQPGPKPCGPLLCAVLGARLPCEDRASEVHCDIPDPEALHRCPLRAFPGPTCCGLLRRRGRRHPPPGHLCCPEPLDCGTEALLWSFLMVPHRMPHRVPLMPGRSRGTWAGDGPNAPLGTAEELGIPPGQASLSPRPWVKGSWVTSSFGVTPPRFWSDQPLNSLQFLKP